MQRARGETLIGDSGSEELAAAYPGRGTKREVANRPVGKMISGLDPRDAHLNDENVPELMRLVRSLRARSLETPNVDPNDGGVNAPALFLLESPGPRAV